MSVLRLDILNSYNQKNFGIIAILSRKNEQLEN